MERIKVKETSVKVNGRETKLFIPQTGDSSYDSYLELAEVEKTRDKMKKLPPRPVSKLSKKDISGTLSEYRDFQKRQKSEFKRKYF